MILQLHFWQDPINEKIVVIKATMENHNKYEQAGAELCQAQESLGLSGLDSSVLFLID